MSRVNTEHSSDPNVNKLSEKETSQASLTKSNKQNFFQKHFYSLPARILAVFLIQTLLTLLLLTGIGLFVVQNKTQQRIPLLLTDYLERLVRDMPSPLNHAFLYEMQKETGLHFAYEKHGYWLYFTVPQMRTYFDYLVDRGEWMPFKTHHNWRWQFDQGNLLVVIPYEEGHLWIHFGLRKKSSDEFAFWLVLGVITVMLILTYLWVRQLLKPIREIQKGVDHYSGGDFKYRLEANGRSDLTELSLTINHMAEEIANRLQKEHELFIAMSHELRTPLTRMRVAMEMLDDESLKKIMLRSLHAMEELIETLLLREKALQTDETNEQWVDETHLIKWLQTDFPDQFDAFILKLDKASLMTDAFALRLILKNLVVNAIKYGNNKPIEIGMKPKKYQVEFWVKDEGVGLNTHDLAHLFDPFYRADQARARQTGGFGLGLYLSQALAKRLGSQIKVESELGKGSRFSLIVPTQPLDENGVRKGHTNGK